MSRNTVIPHFTMKALVILGVLCATSVPTVKAASTNDEQHGNDARIIGVKPTSPDEFQCQCFIRIITGQSDIKRCGGSLISDQWILTAAHCTEGANLFIIDVNGHDLNISSRGLTFVTRQYFRHPDYNKTFLNNDIALLKLRKPVTFSGHFRATYLPSRDLPYVGPGEPVIAVSGYGINKESTYFSFVSSRLTFVEMTTISNEECAEVNGSRVIQPSVLCAVGNATGSPCMGDGGSALGLNVNGKAIHVGVLSLVHKEGCTIKKPVGFTRTMDYLDWIAGKTGLDI